MDITTALSMALAGIFYDKTIFLDASSHLYKMVCPSGGPSVRRSVGMSRFCKKCIKLRVLCTEMILKAYKVMNNIKVAL